MTDLDAMILDLANDDYTGLWEFIWQAEAARDGIRRDEIRATLGLAIERLILAGKLEIFRGVSFTGEEQPISGNQAHSVLANPRSWEPAAAGEAHIRVVTPGRS